MSEKIEYRCPFCGKKLIFVTENRFYLRRDYNCGCSKTNADYRWIFSITDEKWHYWKDNTWILIKPNIYVKFTYR